MAAVIVTTEASFAELQTEVRITNGLTLVSTNVRRQTSQYEITTLQVTSDAVLVFEAAEIAV